MSVEVVTVCSHIPTQSYYYYERGFLASLKRLGVEPVVLGFGEHWGGLITKPKRLRHYLRHVCQSETVIACDCFDMVFTEPPSSIAERYHALYPAGEVVFNAERGLFPRGDLADYFPETGTPFRYLNSGFMMGRRDDLLTMIETVEWDAILEDTRVAVDTEITYGGVTRTYEAGSWFNPNDQGDYQEIWSRKPVPMALDAKAELCITMHGADLSEFEVTDKTARYLPTDSVPGAWHFNGGAKNELLPHFLEKWGL